jgi:FKBP-type peptidyl-prolyl cis-trans isomerase/DinB superfamily
MSFRVLPLFLLAVLAQTARAQFDPKMPAGVPEVTGTAVENLSMHYIDIAVGTGAPAAPGKQYTVHYTGWLRNGTKFDSSVDRKEPLQFVQGRRLVISGWEAGFEGMHVGGKRRLFIPYQLAYGEAGQGSIPPKSELIFDVELLGVADVPPAPAAADILLSFSDSESKVIALAKAVPEEKYSWRPAPGVRSFGEVFVHIVAGNKLLLTLATSTPSAAELNTEFEAQSKFEKQAFPKTRIIEMLTESFATVRKSLESVRPGTLAREASFFGAPTTRRGIFVNLDVHIAEHLGQAIAYARMNGIIPPWSQ